MSSAAACAVVRDGQTVVVGNEILRRAAAYFARDPLQKMTFPLVADLAADDVPVRLACEVLGFSAQAFYKWRARPCSDRDWADAHAINAIVDVHGDDPEFGYRFIADELEQLGERSCERRVRLCRQQRVWSTTTRKGRKASGKTPGPAVHDDLVQRVFTAPAPDLVWMTDITEHTTPEGRALLLLDQGRVLEPDRRVLDRLPHDHRPRGVRVALNDRSPPDGTVVVHSERGGQFRSRKFRATLKANKLTGSMGRVASAADNAAMESFDALLQKDVLNRRRVWKTRAELGCELIVWIEHTYDNRRRQRALGRFTPVEYELAFTPLPCLEDDQAA